LNFKIDKLVVVKRLIHQIYTQKEKFGGSNEGEGKTVLVEFRYYYFDLIIALLILLSLFTLGTFVPQSLETF
jgi:hypothetical protein